MISKTFEIRDKHTFTSVLATKLKPGNEQDRYLISRAGYGSDPSIQATVLIMVSLTSTKANYNSRDWTDVTMQRAHEYILEHFDSLESGSVIDVEFIHGETTEPKRSEAELDRLGVSWGA